MKLVLSHDTALDLLRTYRCGAPFQLIRTRATSLSDSAHTKTEIAQFEFPSFQRSGEELHILVPLSTMLCNTPERRCHLMTQSLPEGSLLLVGNKVYVASPPLVFVQFGAKMTWLGLAMLGAEFCGMYSLKPGGKRGMIRCMPITNTRDLMRFIERLPRMRGAKTARDALRWVPDLSASPLESALYLLLTLPVKRGGYGLPKPDMNPATHLSARNARALEVDNLHCDLHWQSAHVALEYNSKDAHIGQLTRDAQRANALTSEGEHVFTMTPAILADPMKCDALISQIAHALGHRLRGNALGLSAKRLELRSELFPWIAR